MSPGGPHATSPLVRGWTPCVLVLLFTAVAFVSGSVPAATSSMAIAEHLAGLLFGEREAPPG